MEITEMTLKDLEGMKDHRCLLYDSSHYKT